jgi:hypothetical protein
MENRDLKIPRNCLFYKKIYQLMLLTCLTVVFVCNYLEPERT